MDRTTPHKEVELPSSNDFGGRSSKDIKSLYIMISCLLLLRVRCGFDEGEQNLNAEAEILNQNFPGYDITAERIKSHARDIMNLRQGWIKELQDAGPDDITVRMIMTWLEGGVFRDWNEMPIYNKDDFAELGPLGLLKSTLSMFDDEWKETKVNKEDFISMVA